MSKKGFIKIQRKLFDNFLWNEKRVFSKAEAWIDLIQSARFEERQEIIQNKVIEIHKGELPVSRRYLEKRWNWGGTKVSNFIKTLEELGMVSQRKTKGQTVINLCNYGVFQEVKTSEFEKRIPLESQEEAISKPNIKNRRTKELKERKEEFREKVFSHTQIDLKILESFFEYWSEHGALDKKMKFEKLKTFAIKNRLNTWLKNEKKWNNYKEPIEKNDQNSQKINRQTTRAIANNAQGWGCARRVG